MGQRLHQLISAMTQTDGQKTYESVKYRTRDVRTNPHVRTDTARDVRTPRLASRQGGPGQPHNRQRHGA